jgi:hypothetical protein
MTNYVDRWAYFSVTVAQYLLNGFTGVDHNAGGRVAGDISSLLIVV